MSIATTVPFFLSKIKKMPAENEFRLTDLSKTIAILFIYTCIGTLAFRKISTHVNEYFWVIEISRLLVATMLICAVFKYTPLLTQYRVLFTVPITRKDHKLLILIIGYFLFSSFTHYIKVIDHPTEIFSKEGGLELYRAIYGSYFFLLFTVALDFYFIVGEELVFRYFAVNALKSNFNNKQIIIVSSLLWTLMHEGIYLNVFISGLIYAYIYIKTERLFPCVFLHFLFNEAGTSQSFYLYYKSILAITITPLQYGIMLFLVMIVSYYLLEILFGRNEMNISKRKKKMKKENEKKMGRFYFLIG